MAYSSHKHDNSESCKCNSRTTSTAQNLDELDFDRGIWSAGENLEEI
jgi:hypothetical protein